MLGTALLLSSALAGFVESTHPPPDYEPYAKHPCWLAEDPRDCFNRKKRDISGPTHYGRYDEGISEDVPELHLVAGDTALLFTDDHGVVQGFIERTRERLLRFELQPGDTLHEGIAIDLDGDRDHDLMFITRHDEIIAFEQIDAPPGRISGDDPVFDPSTPLVDPDPPVVDPSAPLQPDDGLELGR